MIIYTACLALGLIFTIISATMGHFFGGHDGGGDVGTGGHAEAGYDHSGVPGISFFSPTVLSSFVTAFGACGIILTKIGSPVWVIAPIPENGVGQISYVQGGSRYTAPARTESGTPISGGKLVRITKIVGTDF